MQSAVSMNILPGVKSGPNAINLFGFDRSVQCHAVFACIVCDVAVMADGGLVKTQLVEAGL